MTELHDPQKRMVLDEAGKLTSIAFEWVLRDADRENEEHKEYYYKEVLEPAWIASDKGISAYDVLCGDEDLDNIVAARVMAMYYAEVEGALEAGEHEGAWKLVAEANYFAGLFSAYIQYNPLRENARNAAGARHTENREIAERIQAWYAENHHRYRSKDAAAEAVTRVEPVAFKTARKHIGAAAKNLPSARKA